jgi:hypothetical protein
LIHQREELRRGHWKRKGTPRDHCSDAIGIAGHPDRTSPHPRRRPAHTSTTRMPATNHRPAPPNHPSKSTADTPRANSISHTENFQDRIREISPTGTFSEEQPAAVRHWQADSPPPRPVCHEPRHPGVETATISSAVDCTARTTPWPVLVLSNQRIRSEITCSLPGIFLLFDYG